jgi:competence protein ComEC
MSGEDTNAASLVLMLSYGEFSMLLTGDAGEAGEHAATVYWEQYHAGETLDLFKSSHHGSNYSNTEELLTAMRPEYTIISCSKTNRYGHPGKDAMQRMDEAGCEILCTMSGGAIMISTDGKDTDTEVRTYIR